MSSDEESLDEYVASCGSSFSYKTKRSGDPVVCKEMGPLIVQLQVPVKVMGAFKTLIQNKEIVRPGTTGNAQVTETTHTIVPLIAKQVCAI